MRSPFFQVRLMLSQVPGVRVKVGAASVDENFGCWACPGGDAESDGEAFGAVELRGCSDVFVGVGVLAFAG